MHYNITKDIESANDISIYFYLASISVFQLLYKKIMLVTTIFVISPAIWYITIQLTFTVKTKLKYATFKEMSAAHIHLLKKKQV